MSCKSVHKQLSAFVDGQLSEMETESALAHAKKCKVCATVLMDFQKTQNLVIQQLVEKQPSAEIWHILRSRISSDRITAVAKQRRFDRIQQMADRYFTPQPVWVRLAVFATVFFVGILIGASFWHSSQKNQDMQIAGTTATYQAASTPISLASKEALDESFLRQRLDKYLQKSDLVLTEIKNYEQPEEVELVDFSQEKAVSKDLIEETLYIKRSLSGTQYTYMKSLVDELEMVFLDIANIDEDKAQDEIEMLSGQIVQKNLLIKINVVKLDETSEVPKKKGKIGA